MYRDRLAGKRKLFGSIPAEASAMRTYFRVSIPSSNKVGVGTMKTFLTRREAEEFLKAEHAQSTGVIEEVNEKGKPIYHK
jgi:hypothetical protein